MAGRLMRGPADLHTHSSVSDGTDSPAELVTRAAAAGLGTIAITDHDTVAGWPEAFAAAAEARVTVIGGMELSTRSGWHSVHLLAYLVNPADPALAAETDRIRTARRTRAAAMVERLAVDYDLTWADVLDQTSPASTIGRPHIADAMVAKGIVADRSTAFETLLAPSAGYYQPIYAPTPLDAVRLVRGAGGVPVLAHPATRGRRAVLDEDTLTALVAAGLGGVEADHRENTPDGTAYLRDFARRTGLIVTGSSDYHGNGKPNRLGENTTPIEVVERIVAEATGAEPMVG